MKTLPPHSQVIETISQKSEKERLIFVEKIFFVNEIIQQVLGKLIQILQSQVARKVRLPRRDELEDGALFCSLVPAGDKLFNRARFCVGEIE